MSARQWLAENGYTDVLTLIAHVGRLWKAKGVSTRRNWWEVLAGDKSGRPRIVEGIEFPILAAAQAHERMPLTQSAVQRSRKETPPKKDYRGKSRRKAASTSRSKKASTRARAAQS